MWGTKRRYLDSSVAKDLTGKKAKRAKRLASVIFSKDNGAEKNAFLCYERSAWLRLMFSLHSYGGRFCYLVLPASHETGKNLGLRP